MWGVGLCVFWSEVVWGVGNRYVWGVGMCGECCVGCAW